MGKGKLIESIEKKYMKKEVPHFDVGDTIKVSVRIIDESGKERLQAFAGTVIAKKGSGLSETFSVHRIAYGEGMERVFFLHSPLVSNIEIVRKGVVARCKLYYLRGTRGKAAKVKSRFFTTKKEKKALSAEVQPEVAADQAPAQPAAE